jgi:hypothetical protein
MHLYKHTFTHEKITIHSSNITTILIYKENVKLSDTYG